MIKLKEISKEDAFRYMGGDYSSINEEELKILKENEKLLLENINVRYVYKVFDIDNETMMIGPNIKLEGQSIKNHLKDCNKVIFLAATLSSSVDEFIRKRQVSGSFDMVCADALASAAIEDALKLIDLELINRFKDKHLTWRFGVGYGDFPLEFQSTFLDLANARKLIGLNLSDGGLLTPTKSVTCIIGVSDRKLDNNRDIMDSYSHRCSICNMKDVCAYSKYNK
ncbi:MAG TPA: hypothetical protein DCW44_03425 [Eubacterium sp.]|nr:hypothetical protein [Eubacterium sp.]